MMRFRICSVDISISFWSILFISYAVVTSLQGQLLVLICIICTLVHELGHLIMILKYKGKPDRIAINPFEIRICTDLSSLKTREDFIVSSFGIIANIILSLLSFLLYLIIGSFVFKHIAISSAVIGAMNILPIDSFDGGQMLRIILLRFLSQRSVDFIINIISVVLVFPLIIIGIGVLFSSRYNFSVLFVGLYLLSIYIIKELR